MRQKARVLDWDEGYEMGSQTAAMWWRLSEDARGEIRRAVTHGKRALRQLASGAIPGKGGPAFRRGYIEGFVDEAEARMD